jgi:thiol-disulfide isomerase/thioredoxin
MNKKVFALAWISLSILLFFLTTLIGAYDHKLKFVIVLFVYLLYTNSMMQKWEVPKVLSLSVILLPTLLLIWGHAQNWSATSIGHLSTLSYFLGTIAGYCIYVMKKRNSIRLVIFLLALAINTFIYTWAYDKYLFVSSFNSLDGIVKEELPSFTLTTNQNSEWTLDKQRKEYFVFDFWNSRCGVCYTKFPQLDKLTKKYQSHPSVAFYAINVPILDEKASDNIKLLDSFNYTFPILYARDSLTAKQFKVEWYPTVLILKKDEGIVYRGDIENVESALNKFGIKF